jgi:hypothetical protein
MAYREVDGVFVSHGEYAGNTLVFKGGQFWRLPPGGPSVCMGGR